MHRWLFIAGLFVAAGASISAAQDSPAPVPNTTQSGPPAAPPRKTLKKAAIPDAIPDAPAPAADAVPEVKTGDPETMGPAASPPAPGGKKHSTADNNPFPEEFSKAAAKDGGDTAPLDPSESDSPSSDAKSAVPDPTPGSAPATESSSQQGLDKLDLYGDKDKKHRKNADPDAGLPFDPNLAAQDNKIGELYLKNGNAPGAYSRFKEAAQYDAGNADAVFGLAEAAQQMNLVDEAAQAYQTYLFAFPDGSKARLAKKALAELKVKGKR